MSFTGTNTASFLHFRYFKEDSIMVPHRMETGVCVALDREPKGLEGVNFHETTIFNWLTVLHPTHPYKGKTIGKPVGH